jgi:endonuclease YncB( thermonuclease family)
MLWFGFRVRAHEVHVYDGDTIWWRRGGWGPGEDQNEGAKKYRLAGHDAPEVRRRRSVSENQKEWGKLAAARLRELLDGAKDIRIRPVIFGQRYTRNHPTRLAQLIIDGVDASALMIDEDMAAPVETRDGRIVRTKWDDRE